MHDELGESISNFYLSVTCKGWIACLCHVFGRRIVGRPFAGVKDINGVSIREH
jgi:hypothetical protein